MMASNILAAFCRAAVVLTVPLLGACTDADWASVTAFPTASASSAGPSRPAAEPSQRFSAACARAADERSTDAAVQGFDPDIQRDVRDKTYADCLTWSPGVTSSGL